MNKSGVGFFTMRFLAVFVVVAAAAVSLGGGGATVGEAAATSCAAQAVNFGPASRPFSPSLQLPALAQARGRIGFQPRLPAGRPFRIYVSREREVRHRRLGLSYRRTADRWFLLTEGRVTSSRARFEAMVREMSARDECGDANTARLRNGSLALLLESRDRRVLRFRAAGIDILLLGSPTSASSSRLVAVANSLTK